MGGAGMTGGVHAHMRAWEPEEDECITMLLDQFGPKWTRIVQQLPGRTVSSCRNRWQRIEKGNKMRAAGLESKNRCQRCGEPRRGHICRVSKGQSTTKLKGRAGQSTKDNAGVKLENAAFDGGMLANNVDMRAWEPEETSSQIITQHDPRVLFLMAPADTPVMETFDQLNDKKKSATMQLDPDGVAVMPILGRMKSADRICSELGFESLAAAAAIHVSRVGHRDGKKLCMLDTAQSLSDAPEL